MLRYTITGLPVLVLCLLLEGIVVALALRYYARFRKRNTDGPSPMFDIMLLSMVMTLTLVGNFIQMAIWAVLFLWLGEFGDFPTALYHSGVNFATLGYGDIVMSPRWRMLGPMEAANGILMFGVSTAVMTAAVMDVVKYNIAYNRKGGEDN